MRQRALVLFAHGARDPRWAEPFQRLQQIAQAQLPDVTVALAFLELMTPSLPELVEQYAASGCSDFTIVPVFLGQGGHVRRDLPRVIEQLQAAHPQARFNVAIAAGEDPEVLGAIARYCIAALPKA
jgi:sirohydrochlorin cobaltochelatase